MNKRYFLLEKKNETALKNVKKRKKPQQFTNDDIYKSNFVILIACTSLLQFMFCGKSSESHVRLSECSNI